MTSRARILERERQNLSLVKQTKPWPREGKRKPFSSKTDKTLYGDMVVVVGVDYLSTRSGFKKITHP